MSHYTKGSNESHGRIANTTDECPICGATTRRYGTSDQSGAKIETRCPNCGPVETPILADGGQTAYDVLATYNDTNADRLQQFLDGDLTKNDLTVDDIARTLRLSLGELCLEVRHEYKTEFVWATANRFVSKTVFDASGRNAWGPIDIDDASIDTRLKQNKQINIRLTDAVDAQRPESAYAQEVRA